MVGGVSARCDTKRALTNVIRFYEPQEFIRGVEGYRRVAELFCGSSMQKAFILASTVCKAEKISFSQLEWGSCLQCTTKQFTSLRQSLAQAVDDKSLGGILGYIAFADTYCSGKLGKAFQLASAVCKAEGISFSQLEWGTQLHCTTATLPVIKEHLLRLKMKGSWPYSGEAGMGAFAIHFCQGKERRAQRLVKNICKANKIPFKLTCWK